MAVTGTSVFTVSRDDVINSALRLIGALGVGETPITEDYTNCSQNLNIMIKSWAKKGMPLWVTQDLSIPMVVGANAYPIGPTAGYVYSLTLTNGGTGYAASGSLVFTGGGGTGAAGTFTSVGGVIKTVTLTAGGSSFTSAPIISAATGASLTVTVTLVGITMSRPLKIIDGTFIRDSNSNDTTLMLISRQEYNMQANKTSPGIPNQFYYDRQEANGILYVINVPVDSTSVIHAQIQRQFFDMTAGTDNFDFPEEFFQALKWGLAAEIAAEYGVSLQMIPYYETKAEKFIEESFDYSVEEASIYFTVDPQVTVQHG